MSELPSMSEYNFGEFDARQEYLRDSKFFISSFVPPSSISLSVLSNKNRFIIVGRKGCGKSACQLFIEAEKGSEGYLTGFLSFYGDLAPSDYLEFQKTQKLKFLDADYVKNISVHYDFREVWYRVFFIGIANIMKSAGIDNSFTQFCLSTKGNSNSIVDGISKSLRISVKLNLGFLSGDLSFDPSDLVQNGEVSLQDFNRIAKELIKFKCLGTKIFYSIDELVVSNLSATTDEYKVRLSLIRDVVKVSNELNNFFVRHDIDWHITCSLRPEVRDQLNKIDAEISKIIDSNYIPLTWTEPVSEDHPLMQVLHEKINNGSPTGDSQSYYKRILPEYVTLSDQQQPFATFLLNQGWFRPRDIVRFLKVYQAKNGRDRAMSEDGIKNSLSEYSRISAKEAFDELAVKYSIPVIEKIQKQINRRTFDDKRELQGHLAAFERLVNLEELMDDLFQAGIISNVDYVRGKPRYFSSYREEETLDDSMKIIIHPGLWSFFNIRHR